MNEYENDTFEIKAVEHCNEVLCSICEKRSCSIFRKCKEWRDRRAGYYCGIESREKQIEELEETINKLREQLSLRYFLEDKIEELKNEINKLIDVINEQDVKIADLEKENKHLTEVLTGEALIKDELETKLVKAKQIIKEYYDLVEIMLLHHKIDTEKSVKLEVKVEQFLKEIEK